LVRRYTYWKTEQRLPFLQHLAQQRAESAVQLTEYNKRQAQLEQDQKIAEAMNNAEEADEKYKADHCIHCPKCPRIM
jgi:Tfp pilus assembly protein PilX